MGVSIQKARDLKQAKSQKKGAIDILDEFNERNYTYNTAAVISGKRVEIRKYDEQISVNKDIDIPTSNVPADFQHEKDGRMDRRLNFEERKVHRIRSNRRRKRRIRDLIRTNTHRLTTYIVLTMGNKDYKEVMENLFESFEEGEFKFHPIKWLEIGSIYHNGFEELEGIKKIDKCDNEDDSRLDKNKEKLRKELVDYLSSEMVTGKAKRTENRIIKQYGHTLSKRRLNQKIKREIPRQLDSLICNGDPHSIDDAQKEFSNFRDNRINNGLLKKDEYSVDKLEYIKVLELQQNGRVHYNLVCNLPYIDQWKLQKLWRNGIVHIKRIGNIHEINFNTENISVKEEDDREEKFSKLAYYLYTEVADTSRAPKTQGRQLVTASKNIHKPLRITSTVLFDRVVKEYIEKAHHKPDYKKNIESQYEEGIDFYLKIYNLEKRDLYEEILDICSELIDEMISLAEDKGKEEITQDEFDQAIEDYKLPLTKDYHRFKE